MSRPYTGKLAGITFEDGEPVDDDQLDDAEAERRVRALLGYADRHGLRIEDGRLVVVDRDDPSQPSHPTHEHVGAPLRDAAVDPRPGDHLAPVTTSDGGTVTPQVHGDEAGAKPIVPGPVPDDPDAEDAKESAAAAAAVAEFDPSAHNIDAVNAHLGQADADERARVLAAEKDGKGRKGIVEGPHA